MDQSRLFRLLQRWVPALLATSQALGSVLLVGCALKRIVPVADYTGRYPLSEQLLKEWAVLYTFDWLAPTILKSYELLSDKVDESVEHVRFSAKLLLSVKRALESHQEQIVTI